MDVNEIIKPENLVYDKPRLMNDNPMHYCPGCSHGVVHKLVAEVIDEMGMEEQAIGIAPVGCAVFAYNYIDIDWLEAAHGRAPAIATAVKRLNPSKMVFTYQGDGDLAAIGTAETIHACNRGENIVIIFINNAIYGMTGGQMRAYDIRRNGNGNLPLRKKCRIKWLSAKNIKSRSTIRRDMLCYTSKRAHGCCRKKSEESITSGF